MQLNIRHTLTFTLPGPGRAVQHLLLTPIATPQQKIVRWSLEMPGFAEAATFRDGFGNRANLVTQVKPETEIVVVASGTVETSDRAGVLGRLEYDPMPAMFRRQTAATRPEPRLIEGLDLADGRIATLHVLMERVFGNEGAGTPAETARPNDAEGRSQAQGSVTPPGLDAPAAVHAFIGAARALDVPARYVTGYLLVDGHARFHAWAEAWDDGLGWIGFDPVLNLCPTDSHVRIAAGLDAVGTVPIRAVPAWSARPAETLEIAAGD